MGHPLPWSSGLQPTCPGCGIWDWPPPPLTNVVAYWRGFAGEPGSGAEGGLNGGVVIVLNNSPRVREVPLGKLLAGADKPTAGKPAGDKPTGEDQVAGERKAAGGGNQVTVTVLLDGTRGIDPGAEVGPGRQGTAAPPAAASGTAPSGTVSVPPFGAILLHRSRS